MNDFNKIEEFLESGIKESLTESTSLNFTEKLMREVEMAKEFAKQDKKTYKLLNFIIAGVITVIITSGVMLAYLLGGEGADENPGGFIAGTKDLFNGLSAKVFGLFGISLSGDAIMYVFFAGAAIIMFSLIDRFVLKKSYN
ncbi:MAG: hypothetical protein PHN88_04905 [Ignavibacteria bacterium]|nr:hypothetical protein [Ignavibacteria bacterium]